EAPPARSSRSHPPAGVFAMAALEVRGRSVTKGGVKPALVIENLDVIEGLLLGLGVALEPLAELGFERRKPALHGGVVVAVPAATHAADNAVVLKVLLVVL